MNRKKLVPILLIFMLLSLGAAFASWAHWEDQQNWFYYDEDGEMLRSQWLQDRGNWYYLGDSGIMVTGWRQIGGKEYFFDEDGTAVTGLAIIDGRLYCFGYDHALYTGSRRIGDMVLTFTREGLDPQVLGGDVQSAASYTTDGVTLQDASPDADRGGQNRKDVRLIVLLMAVIGGGIVIYCLKVKRAASCLPIFIAVCMASTPVFLVYLIYGHDINFHLNRILGIKMALRRGILPVRMNAFTLNGYGYADPIFYPSLFLYIPALLDLIGFQFVPSVNLFLLIVNAASAVVMYYCSRDLFRSEKIGCISAVIYTLCTYRLCNVFVRAAYGEMLAMVFLPLVVYGFYELFFGDERRWMFLSLGITGVVQSHILSLLLLAIVCVAAGLVCIRRVLTKSRFCAVAKMLVSTLFLNLWFLLPLIEYMRTDIDTGALMHSGAKSSISVTKLIEFFSREGGVTAYMNQDISSAMATSLGAAIVIGSLLFIYEFAAKRKESSRMAVVLFVMGSVFAFMATDIFPWQLLSRIGIISTFLVYLQFPWRFLSFASCLLSMTCAYAFARATEGVHKNAAVLLVLILSLISSQYLLNGYTRQKASFWSQDDVISVIDQGEYLYPNTDRRVLDGSCSASENVTLTEWSKDGLEVSFTYTGDGQEAYVDIPLFCYPHYHAIDSSGRELGIIRNEKNTIRVRLDSAQGTVTVAFREPFHWRILEGIAIAVVLWILAEFLRYYRGFAARKNTEMTQIHNE